MSFILRGWCAIGSSFLEIRREAVFVYRLKSTNHEVVHLFLISKSIDGVYAADWIYNNNVQAGVFSEKADGRNYIMYIVIKCYALGDTGKNENPIYHRFYFTHTRMHAHAYIHTYIHTYIYLSL